MAFCCLLLAFIDLSPAQTGTNQPPHTPLGSCGSVYQEHRGADVSVAPGLWFQIEDNLSCLAYLGDQLNVKS